MSHKYVPDEITNVLHAQYRCYKINQFVAVMQKRVFSSKVQTAWASILAATVVELDSNLLSH